MSRAAGRAHRLLASLALLLLGAAQGRAASRFDPQYRFRSTRTEHFVVYFHQGEDAQAARLATIAEDTWRRIERPLGVKPPPLTHVVLADQSEIANGFATPLPRDTIVVTAAWPPGSDFLGNADDWLRLVFTHEFTHIVHLDRSESWARAVRAILGRNAIAFPNLYLPAWQIEGLATYEESALTGQGRLHAEDFQAITREAARANRLEPLDRVNGGLIDWPGGLAAYAYGLGFHDYLADRYGPDRFQAMTEATARRVPYTSFSVFQKIYGRSLDALWSDYRASLVASLPASSGDGATRLTRHGFVVSGPRFASACVSCPLEILYSRQDPHDFPSLNRIALDGSSPVALATRYQGSTVGVGRTIVYFDQQEIARNTGLYSDLYVLTRANGHVERITRDARLQDPDLSPDERTIVAVQSHPGRRDLVLIRVPVLRFAEGKPDATDSAAVADVVSGSSRTAGAFPITTLLSAPDTQFNAPRWSPDGRAIAVERHRLGSVSEIVIVDVTTREVRTVASDTRARWVTPAWRPDGRALVAASDWRDTAFNLFELDLDPPFARRRMTQTTGGAQWPDVSADGRWIVYAGYTADGFDLFRMMYPAPGDPVAGATSSADEPQREDAPQANTPERTAGPARPYSPWPTLAPTWWSPILTGQRNQLRAGAATFGSDVLGYHGYAASASWLLTYPAGAAGVDRAAVDWEVSYTYDRWLPAPWIAASRQTSFFSGPPSDRGAPSAATLYSRQIEAGVMLPISRVRVRQRALASFVYAANEFQYPDRVETRHRPAVRGGWTISSAHTYGYSISPERGATFGMTGEIVPGEASAAGGAGAVTADTRLYLPGIARHHVLALRMGGGWSSGDRLRRRTFNLGGAGPNADPLDFGQEVLSLLRGFPADTFAGSRVVLVNADYRWPIVRPQRGAGIWPFFAQRIYAAAFADAGQVGTRTISLRDAKTAFGGELSADLVVGYGFPLTLTVGAARGHDGSHAVADRASVYLRVGRAF